MKRWSFWSGSWSGRDASRGLALVFLILAALAGNVRSAERVIAASGQPNLAPQNVILSTYSAIPGDVITVEWTMTNSGSGFCPASFTGVRLGGSPTVPPSASPVDLMFTTPEIAAKSTVKQTATVTIPFTLPFGTYYIWVIADVFGSGLNQTTTADEAAHSAALTVQNVRGQPNLRPFNIELSATTVRPGDLLTVMWTLTNSGPVVCPSSFTGLHLGTSSLSPPLNDVLNVLVPTPEIAAHSAVRFTNVVTIPSTTPLDTYFLWVVADDVVNSTLNQSSREDDAARSPALMVNSVVPRPNLVPLNVTLNRYSARPGEQVAVMWTLTNSGTGHCPASITGLHLGVSGTAPPVNDPLNFKLPTPSIDAGASLRMTNIVTVPPNAALGTYFLWVIADDVANSTIGQTSREDDAARSAPLTLAATIAQPNILPLNILLSSYSIRPGDQLSVMWTTTNVGNGDCPASLTGLHLGTSRFSPPAGDALDIRLATPEIPAQSAVRQTNTVTIPSDTPTGNYYLWVVVDDVPQSTLGQTSRDDDGGRSTVLAIVNVVGQPNLVPQNVTLDAGFARPGEQVTVRWTMRNTGNVTCPTSLTGLRLTTSASAPTNSIVEARFATPEIGAGVALEQTNTVTIPSDAPVGTYYLWVIADDVATSTLNQSSRNDDLARSGPFAISPEPPKPNLVPLNVTLNVASNLAGAQLAVTWTMTNSGSANCPASITGLHLGTATNAPPGNDSLNVKLPTPAIAAGSSLQQSNTIIIPANLLPGTYYLWVVADDVPNSPLNQSSKADDGAQSGPLTIIPETPRPNLVPPSVALNLASAKPGDRMLVTWTMTNSGNADCPASTTGLHLGTSASAVPVNDSMNLKIATPAIASGSSTLQSNLVTIPGNVPPGTYYVWVVADDVPNSSLNQTSKDDDAARSGPVQILSGTVSLLAPAAAQTVPPPPAFSWSSPGLSGTTVYIANKPAPILGTDSVVFLANPGGSTNLKPTDAEWLAAVSSLGVSESYYWTVGSGNAAQRQVYTGWRAFKIVPVIVGGAIVHGSDGDFQFDVIAPNHSQVIIQSSEHLANDWSDLQTLTNTTGTVNVVDEQGGERSKRFYRLKP